MHVFLIGRHDFVQIRELLATRVLKIYLHDCEQYSDDLDAVFSKGIAKFTLRDFLWYYCRELKLRSEVLPTKRLDADNTNIDLNTTAKKT